MFQSNTLILVISFFPYQIVHEISCDVFVFNHNHPPPQHYKDHVFEILKEYRIGSIDPKEWVEDTKEASIVNDPYANDPKRSPLLKFHSVTPCNAETPPELIAAQFITPNELFFIRNHSPVPVLDEDTFRLVIKGREGQEDRTFTLTQLRNGFKNINMTSTLQCGGNRRHGLKEVMGKPACSGTEWDLGAISTARWTGVSLREVLDFCGHSHSYCKQNGVEHVIFEGADGVQASIPIAKALCPGECVILAFEMNGEPLPKDHGYPVRVIVPGHVGIRNIKWVNRIQCSPVEAEGPWQRGIAYKGFNPSQTSPAGVDVEKISSLQEMPIQSAIVSPLHNGVAVVEDGKITTKGYAWSGGGRAVIRVDVSADGGNTWHTADLGEGSDQPADRAWAWTLWECDIPLPPGVVPGAKLEICCRATDASYNVQPESTKSIWNLRGIVNNAWHRVHVGIVQDS